MVRGIEHFHLYLYGSSFQVIADHKPLETIFNNPTCKATARLERLQLRLQPCKTKIMYKPGADNPADYMTRHTDPKQSQNFSHLSRVDAYINFVTTYVVPPAVTLQEVKGATAADETLQNLAWVITNQRWHEVGKDVSQYQQIKQELSISNGVSDDEERTTPLTETAEAVEPVTQAGLVEPVEEVESSEPPTLRRSGRIRREPEYLKDYIT